MSELSIELHWHRQEVELKPGQYSAEHLIRYNDHYELKGDAAPDWGGKAENTNPEQALAAALSSCHMMTYLALAAKAGWPVVSYADKAIAYLGKNPKGQMSVTRIDLHPIVKFDTGFEVDDDKLADMQERAHRYCFIANTLAEHVEMKVL